MIRPVLAKFSIVSLILALSLPVGCGAGSTASSSGGGGGGTPTSSGDLITTFGDIGFILNNPEKGDYVVNDVVLSNDGTHLFLIGTSTMGALTTGRVEKRSLSTGDLDTSFDTDGIYTSAATGNNTQFNAGTIGWQLESSVNVYYLFVAGAEKTANNGLQWWVEKIRVDTGALDSNFGQVTAGVYKADFGAGTYDDIIYDVIFDPVYKKIFLAGTDASGTGGTSDWVIEKVDAEDGSNNLSVTSASTHDGEPVALIFSDPDLWVLGTNRNDGAALGEWRLEKRLNTSSLALDGTWPNVSTGPGYVTTNIGGGDNVAAAMVKDSVGNFYLLGTDGNTGGGAWRIEKWDSQGSQDPIFGSVTINPSSGADTPHDLIYDAASNALFLVGMDNSPTGSDFQWRIEKRVTTNGKLFNGTDASPAFDTDGILTINPSTGNDSAMAIVQTSGGILVAGTDETHGSGNQRLRMEKRSSTDGSAVTDFGTPGIASSNPTGTLDDSVHAVAGDGTNYSYSVGSDSQNGATDQHWRIEKRLLSTGELVSGFPTGGNGIITEGFSSTAANDIAYGVAIDGQQAYVVGTRGVGVTGGTSWMIQPYRLTDGSTAAFNITTDATLDPTTSDDKAYGVAVDATNLYTVGSKGGISGGWEIQARVVSNGSGVWTVNSGAQNDVAYAVALDTNYLYVVGLDADGGTGSNGQWEIQKRDKTNGALESVTFSPGGTPAGTIQSDPSSGVDEPRAVVVDTTNGILYVGGYDADASGSSGGRWRIEAYSSSTGAPVSAFGGSGSVSVNPGSGVDRLYGMLLDSGYLFITGSSDEGGSAEGWSTVKIDASTGSLDTSFGTSGFVSSSTGSGARGIVTDSTGNVVLVGDDTTGGTHWRFEKRMK